MPVDNYFIRLMAEVIHTNQGTCLACQPQQIIIPVYGVRFDESTNSKYPQWLKRLQLGWIYWQRQSNLEKTLRERLKPYLDCQEIRSIKLVPVTHFFLASIFDHFIFRLKTLLKLPNATKIREFDLSDQVIDTYLRFKPSAKYNSQDPFIKDIWHRARALNYLIKYYSRHVKSGSTTSICSYTTYITGGVFSRQSVASGCTLITLGNSLSYFKIHNKTNSLPPSHMEDHCLYTLDQAMKLPAQIIQTAEETLYNRTQGKYDNSMPYMTRSHQTDQVKSLVSTSCSKKIVMLLHDFFDSPHAYDWMLFDDFWSWAYESITFCVQNQIPLVIKPHPNQLPESAIVASELQDQFRDYDLVEWLSPSIPNSVIFNQCPKLIVSVYGSVAAEATYCSQPVLLAGDHPGINFNIGFTAKTKFDYWQSLQHPESIPIGSARDAIYFTALHNKNIFSHKNDSLWTHEGIDDKTTESNPEILNTEHVNSYVSKMTKKLLNSVKT